LRGRFVARRSAGAALNAVFRALSAPFLRAGRLRAGAACVLVASVLETTGAPRVAVAVAHHGHGRGGGRQDRRRDRIFGRSWGWNRQSLVAPIAGAVVAVRLVSVAPITTLEVAVNVAPILAIGIATAGSLHAEGAVRVRVFWFRGTPIAAAVTAVGTVDVAPTTPNFVVIIGAPRVAISTATARTLDAKFVGSASPREKGHGKKDNEHVL